MTAYDMRAVMYDSSNLNIQNYNFSLQSTDNRTKISKSQFSTNL